MPFNPQNSYKKYNEHNSQKPNMCFRCGLEDHFIANFSKPGISNKKVHWNKEKHKTCAYILKKKIKRWKKVQMKASHRK